MEEKQNETKIKKYGIVLGFVMFAFQQGVYFLSNTISGLLGIKPYLPKVDAIDDAIKIVPFFIIPYFLSYPYWAFAPMITSKCKKEHYFDYLAAYITAVLFGALVLIFAPTYMDRAAEGLMSFEGKGFLWDAMRFMYSLDGGEMAFNLLPSFHCLVSTIAYLGVAGRKEIPLWYRAFSLVMSVTIYFSTVFVKQHYFLDIFAGILISVVSFVLCKKFHAGRVFLPIIEKFSRKKKAKAE